MSKTLKVLLLEDIESLGRTGDIVTVSEGQARNQLFPEGKAAIATPEVESKQQSAAAQKKKTEEKETVALRKQADKLDSTELVLEVKTKEGDELYGSITAKDIAKELSTQADIDVKPKQISGDLPIKKLGKYDISIELSDEVDFTIQLSVEPDAESKAKLEEGEEE